jgi:hypothetical protein
MPYFQRAFSCGYNITVTLIMIGGVAIAFIMVCDV